MLASNNNDIESTIDDSFDIFHVFDEDIYSNPSKKMRTRLSQHHIDELINIYNEVHLEQESNNLKKNSMNDCGYSETARRFNERMIGGLHITEHAVRYWVQHEGYIRKHGKRIVEDFELEVLDSLIFYAFDEISKSIIKINNIFDYHVLQTQAIRIQNQPKWKENNIVRSLEFKQHWCHSFMQRHLLTRHRITSYVKRICIDDVKKTIFGIQEYQQSMKLTPNQILNMDETGIFYNLPPSFIYDIKGSVRSRIMDSKEKNRFTLIVTANASGELLPGLYILKNNIQGNDQSQSRILNNISIVEQFEERVWEYQQFRCKYLRHRINKTIITSNNTAWNREVIMMLYIDLILIPYAQDICAPLMLIVDNFSVHKMISIRNHAESNNVYIWFLPSNTTSYLQPLDICINGPLKKDITQLRINQRQAYTLDWQKSYAIEAYFERPLPRYEPPKLDIGSCIKLLMDVMDKNKYVNALKECFIRVGLCPNIDGEYSDISRLFDAETPTSPLRIFDLISDIYFETATESEVDEEVGEIHDSTNAASIAKGNNL